MPLKRCFYSFENGFKNNLAYEFIGRVTVKTLSRETTERNTDSENLQKPTETNRQPTETYRKPTETYKN